ncbi:MAG: hypothetical protein RL368_289 [Pseudomonadota bacterium]|jgi:hypothetical protein
MKNNAFQLSGDVSYSFSDYFKLNNEVEDIVAFFGYDFDKQSYLLPQSTVVLDRLEDLILRLNENLLYASMNSEIARREFLIAPVISEIIHYTHSKVKIEYPLSVSEHLKGYLDYLLQQQQHLLVIEAKKADIEQGFLQLAVELIALDKWLEQDTVLLYGAVSTGDIWRFGVLNRQTKMIVQDVNLFRVPADVEDLLRVVIGILGE